MQVGWDSYKFVTKSLANILNLGYLSNGERNQGRRNVMATGLVRAYVDASHSRNLKPNYMASVSDFY